MTRLGLISAREALRIRQVRPVSEEAESWGQFDRSIATRLRPITDSGQATTEELAITRIYLWMSWTNHRRHWSLRNEDEARSPDAIHPDARLQAIREWLLELLLEALHPLRIISEQDEQQYRTHPPQNTAAWTQLAHKLEERLQPRSGRAARRHPDTARPDQRTEIALRHMKRLTINIATGELPEMS